jgi:hypothetical protein
MMYQADLMALFALNIIADSEYLQKWLILSIWGSLG